MTEDLIPILTKFHREIFLPDIQLLIGELREEMNARFDEVNRHFDAIYKRFDRLESEYHVIVP